MLRPEKISVREKAMEVIDVEPLASIDLEEKIEAFPLKKKMDFSGPVEGKFKSDTMKTPRTSRKLVRMRPPTPEGNSSVEGKPGAQEIHEIGKGKGKAMEGVNTPSWNIGKSSRLISVDEKKGVD